MKSSLFSFSHVRACLRRPAARLALLAAPLSLFVLAASPAYGVSAAGFNSAPAITYSTDATYPRTSGGLGGSTVPNSNGIAGVTLTTVTSGALTQTQAGNAATLTTGAFTVFSIAGLGAGTLGATSNVFSGHYNFTLSDSATTPSTVVITGWTLTDGVTASSITNSGSATSGTIAVVPGVPQTFTGTILFPVTGTSLSAYTSTLTVNYSVLGSGTTITATVPTGSIDINVVPEPGTWAMVGLGIAGAAVARGTRLRRRRAA